MNLPGEVVIQTYTPEHYSIELAGEQDFDRFYQQEMMIRKTHKYPPFYYIALITVHHEEFIEGCRRDRENYKIYCVHDYLQNAFVLGPVASPIPRIKNRYRYQCLIKYKREPKLTETLKTILDHYQNDAHKTGLQVSIDINPFMLM